MIPLPFNMVSGVLLRRMKKQITLLPGICMNTISLQRNIRIAAKMWVTGKCYQRTNAGA